MCILRPGGDAQEIPCDRFWQLPEAALAQLGQGWVVSEYAFTEDWPKWEMHPEGDEFVYLLAGAVDLQLEQGGAVQIIALEGFGAVVVPRGAWQTAKVRSPSRMLHVTRRAGTLHRPVRGSGR